MWVVRCGLYVVLDIDISVSAGSGMTDYNNILWDLDVIGNIFPHYSSVSRVMGANFNLLQRFYRFSVETHRMKCTQKKAEMQPHRLLTLTATTTIIQDSCSNAGGQVLYIKADTQPTGIPLHSNSTLDIYPIMSDKWIAVNASRR